MALVDTTINGAGWPTSGAVTAGNSGFFFVDAGMVYRANGSQGNDAAPSWQTSPSYIECDGVERIYAVNWDDVFSQVTGGLTTYWECGMRFRPGPGFVADVAPADLGAWMIFGDEADFQLYARILNRNGGRLGAQLSFSELFTYLTNGCSFEHMARQVDQVSPPDPGYPQIAFNRAFRFGLSLRRASSGGEVAAYLGTRPNCLTKRDRIFGNTLTGASADPRFQLALPHGQQIPANMLVDIIPPFNVFTSVNQGIESPLLPPASHCRKHWPVRFLGTRAAGNPFNVSGTAPHAITQYGPGFQRSRLVVSGTEGQTKTLSGNEPVYDPNVDDSPYNENGDCCIWWKDAFAPGSFGHQARIDFLLRDGNDAANLAKFSIVNNRFVLNDSVDLCSASSQIAYSVVLCLRNNGDFSVGLLDHSTGTQAVGNAQSFPCGTIGGITPGTKIGPIRQSLVQGDTVGSEIGGGAVYSWLTFFLVDSFMSQYEFDFDHGVLWTPLRHGPSIYSPHFFHGQEYRTPGVSMPGLFGRADVDLAGGPIMARSGTSTTAFRKNVLGGMEYLRGIQCVQMDGGFNSQAFGDVGEVAEDFDIISAFLQARRCRYIWGTVPCHIDHAPNNQPQRYVYANTRGRTLARRRRGLVVADVDASNPPFTSNDGVHPDDPAAMRNAHLLGITYSEELLPRLPYVAMPAVTPTPAGAGEYAYFASPGGDRVYNLGGRLLLRIANDGPVSVTVGVAAKITPRPADQLFPPMPLSDQQVVIAPGAVKYIGPIPAAFNDPTGHVTLGYSSTERVTVQPIML